MIAKDDDLPRRAWKLAKIVELIQGRDSKVHAAKIKLPSKILLNNLSICYIPWR